MYNTLDNPTVVPRITAIAFEVSTDSVYSAATSVMDVGY